MFHFPAELSGGAEIWKMIPIRSVNISLKKLKKLKI